MTQKMIAFEFGISIDTVGNLVANVYKKLGVHGAAAAVHAPGRALLLRDPRRLRPHPRAPQGEPLDIVLPVTRRADAPDRPNRALEKRPEEPDEQ